MCLAIVLKCARTIESLLTHLIALIRLHWNEVNEGVPMKEKYEWHKHWRQFFAWMKSHKSTQNLNISRSSLQGCTLYCLQRQINTAWKYARKQASHNVCSNGALISHAYLFEGLITSENGYFSISNGSTLPFALSLKYEPHKRSAISATCLIWLLHYAAFAVV